MLYCSRFSDHIIFHRPDRGTDEEAGPGVHVERTLGIRFDMSIQLGYWTSCWSSRQDSPHVQGWEETWQNPWFVEAAETWSRYHWFYLSSSGLFQRSAKVASHLLKRMNINQYQYIAFVFTCTQHLSFAMEKWKYAWWSVSNEVISNYHVTMQNWTITQNVFVLLSHELRDCRWCSEWSIYHDLFNRTKTLLNVASFKSRDWKQLPGNATP